MASSFSRCSSWAWLLLVLLANATHAADQAPDFEAEIAPLLIKRCVECHQGSNPSGNLVLTGEAGLRKGGDNGAVIDGESPEESFLLLRVHEGEMPPAIKGIPQKLPAEEVQLLERWVAAKAPWPKGRTLDWFERTNEVRAGRDWWSLQPIRRPDVPQLKTEPQPANPIDAFVRARLEQADMVPAPPAGKRTLLRRLYYDLIGLPPTQAQIEKFEADDSPTAWETAVDELLASPHYGERWARYWLDLARYADTSGYERDQEKPFAWKYRDWVVNALNRDMPYHQFVVEQLAGDEIPDRNEQSVIATGFLRLGTWNDEPNEPLDYQYDRLEDMVHTTSSAFLGMTVKCARCHSHKFDPITQLDYYRMGAAFWAGPIAARDRKLVGGPSPEELEMNEVLGWTDLGTKPRPLHRLLKGEREQPLEEVRPASLSMVEELEYDFDPPAADAKTTGRRLQLARWITHPDHPLTARVLVNRLWLHHFGEGIVRSPNNFGFLADPPTHPQLLDWLAAEFLSGGWTIKRMHRLILTSQTWQQSSLHPEYADYDVRDSGNRLWWRAERQRLDAEALRDSMLATTGELDLRLGGPGFRPSISSEALEGLSMKSSAWQASPQEEQLRRSLYMFSKRGLLPPMMTTFDFCDVTQSCGQRDVTTVPTQALALMNNRFVHDRSETLARSIATETNDPSEQAQQLWSRVLERDPSKAELKMAVKHLADQSRRFAALRREEAEQAKHKKETQADDLRESLVLHLKADSGITVDGEGRVSQWKDQSGHEHHAVATEKDQQPRLESDGFAGRPVVAFDGQGRFFKLSGAILDRQEFTILAVVNDQGETGHREIISNWNGAAGNAGTSVFLGLTGQDTVRFCDVFSITGKISDQRNPFVLTALNGEDRSAVFFNGGEIVSRDSALPPRNLSTAWVIGQQGNINGEYWNGGMAEIRVYARALSDAERLSVERAMLAEYKIPSAIPAAKKLPPPETLALASLAHVLLNSNEFLYVD